MADNELSLAMHKALGYDVHMWPHWINIPGEFPTRLQRPKRFLIDRNALPEAWAAIEKVGQWACYLNYLRELDTRNAVKGTTRTGEKWNAITAEPRIHVAAALHALGRWEPAWDAPPAATENDRAAELVDAEQEGVEP